MQVGRGRPGTGRGGVKIVGVLLRGRGWGAGRDRLWRGKIVGCSYGRTGEGGEGEAGEAVGWGWAGGWAVVKARATPGNPASIL